jgi:hypothetical protein
MKIKSRGRVRCSVGIHLMASLATGRTWRQGKTGSRLPSSQPWIFQRGRSPDNHEAGSGRPIAKEV